MKAAQVIFFWLLLAPAMAEPVKMETAALTTDDIADILDLKIEKSKLTFDSPKKIEIEVTDSNGKTERQSLQGTATSATISIFYKKMDETGQRIQARYDLKSSNGYGLSGKVDFRMNPETNSREWRVIGNQFVVMQFNEKYIKRSGSIMFSPNDQEFASLTKKTTETDRPNFLLCITATN